MGQRAAVRGTADAAYRRHEQSDAEASAAIEGNSSTLRGTRKPPASGALFGAAALRVGCREDGLLILRRRAASDRLGCQREAQRRADLSPQQFREHQGVRVDRSTPAWVGCTGFNP